MNKGLPSIRERMNTSDLSIHTESVSQNLLADITQPADIHSGIAVARSRPDLTIVELIGILVALSESAATAATTAAAALELIATRLDLARGPVGADLARTEPLAVHLGDGRLGVHLVHERDEAVALVHERVRILHDLHVRDLAVRRERLSQCLLVDVRRQVSHEYVIVLYSCFISI